MTDIKQSLDDFVSVIRGMKERLYPVETIILAINFYNDTRDKYFYKNLNEENISQFGMYSLNCDKYALNELKKKFEMK